MGGGESKTFVGWVSLGEQIIFFGCGFALHDPNNKAGKCEQLIVGSEAEVAERGRDQQG